MNSTGRYELLGKSFTCSCGDVHEVPTRKVEIGSGALSKTPDALRNLRISGKLFLLADHTTFGAAGKKIKEILEGAGLKVDAHILKDKPYADDITAEDVAAHVTPEYRAIVSCGSGTITDLAKFSAYRYQLPQIAVATAPSMNGYASGIVALTENGIKTTRVVNPPLAVIADLDILAEAPIEMIRAGLGDVISKSVCSADWKIASMIRGDRFCMKPFEMIKDLEELYMNDAAKLQKRDKNVIGALTEALVFSGISMVIAGSSAPASGGEHLISHFLDMRAALSGKTSDLHGAQVGVASIATARLYERIGNLSKCDADVLMLGSAWKRSEILVDKLRFIFGRTAPEILKFYDKKRRGQRAFELEVEDVYLKLRDINIAVREFLLPSEKIEKVLKDAGAKTTFAELGLSRSEIDDALSLALAIRDRFTMLDVAFVLGETEKWMEEIK